jgi:hypothetical protein
MTSEERKEMHHSMYSGAKMILECLEKHGRSAEKVTWQEIMNMSDVLKDLSEMEKNLAKAEHYMKEAGADFIC